MSGLRSFSPEANVLVEVYGISLFLPYVFRLCVFCTVLRVTLSSGQLSTGMYIMSRIDVPASSLYQLWLQHDNQPVAHCSPVCLCKCVECSTMRLQHRRLTMLFSDNSTHLCGVVRPNQETLSFHSCWSRNVPHWILHQHLASTDWCQILRYILLCIGIVCRVPWDSVVVCSINA